MARPGFVFKAQADEATYPAFHHVLCGQLLVKHTHASPYENTRLNVD